MNEVPTEIHGTCAAGFEPVREAFADNFSARAEIGASVAVFAGGVPVVNLWGGWADPGRTARWHEDTLTNVWSTTKAMTSLCAHLLIDRGELDPDAPVARYWPAFAAGGKAEIPVRSVLCHQSGLTGLTIPLSVEDYYDWDMVTGLLAAQEPLFPPGTTSGYQAITFGYLVGEVVRRITGQSCGKFFASEIAGPLGADFFIGLPEAELGRCSQLQGVRPSEDEQAALAQAYANADPAALAALLNPSLTGDEANAPGWRMAEIPAANGHGTALGLVRVFGTLVDGSERLISAKTLQLARAGNGRHTDLVLGMPLEFGLGFGLSGPEGHFGPNPAAFGHDGFGGSAVGGDPEAGVAFAYVMNRMGMNLVDDPRKMAIVDAVYRSLGSR
ncbi:MAG TPA: serine hydrolase domain-containing protein [Streptosporangiaceae bacterium]|nr:serine hydrolase domain-containing protein [Streptosporangiaceae bacterium]